MTIFLSNKKKKGIYPYIYIFFLLKGKVKYLNWLRYNQVGLSESGYKGILSSLIRYNEYDPKPISVRLSYSFIIYFPEKFLIFLFTIFLLKSTFSTFLLRSCLIQILDSLELILIWALVHLIRKLKLILIDFTLLKSNAWTILLLCRGTKKKQTMQKVLNYIQ